MFDKKILLTALGSLALVAGSANAAPVIGVNFNNGDGAGAQSGTTTFGAEWTDVDAASGENLVLNGTGGAVNSDWASQNFWQAGSWTGTDGPNAEIGTMRVYLDDGDGVAAGAPVDLGTSGTDGIGTTVRLQGLSAWLAAEGAIGYNITVYHSTDTNSATFQDVIARDGGTVSSTAIETASAGVGGDGTWDGTSNDGAGNISGGTRASTVFSSVFTQDELTLTSAARDGDTRGNIAAVVITSVVPEPGSLALLGLGGLLIASRRRRA